ncbi:hypothetical protein PO124_34225 [Bacillus licheniformis]|nr:hypothetical protein [Bacillus licheniformis]
MITRRNGRLDDRNQQNNYTMNNWKLDDNFESGGLTLLDGSFRLQDVTNNKRLKKAKTIH